MTFDSRSWIKFLFNCDFDEKGPWGAIKRIQSLQVEWGRYSGLNFSTCILSTRPLMLTCCLHRFYDVNKAHFGFWLKILTISWPKNYSGKCLVNWLSNSPMRFFFPNMNNFHIARDISRNFISFLLWSHSVLSWPILTYSDLFWPIVTHSDPSWPILSHPDPSWPILAQREIPFKFSPCVMCEEG